MRARAAATRAAAIAVLAAACRQIYSVHPLFRDADLLVEPTLLGVWSQAAKPGGERWVFLRPDTSQRTYALGVAGRALANALTRVNFHLMEDDSVTKARLRRDVVARARRSRDSVTVSRLACDSAGPRLFDVQVGRFDGLVFMDISPDLFGCGSRVGPGLMPSHWFWRASLDSARLKLVPLDPDWLGRMIDSSRVSLAHETEGNTLVLTATTSDLQRLLTQFAQDTAAFPEKSAIELRRAH